MSFSRWQKLSAPSTAMAVLISRLVHIRIGAHARKDISCPLEPLGKLRERKYVDGLSRGTRRPHPRLNPCYSSGDESWKRSCCPLCEPAWRGRAFSRPCCRRPPTRARPLTVQVRYRPVWKPVEIKYSYVGFTTAYNCDAFESKVKNILLALGANPLTKVQANGCIDVNRPSRNFFVTITTATPIAASEAKEPDEQSDAGADRAPHGQEGSAEDRAVPGAVEDSRPVTRAPAQPGAGRLRADGRPARQECCRSSA